MSMLIELGNNDIFDFELSDHHNHHYFYSILTKTRQTAIAIAQNEFVKEFGKKATHLEMDLFGYPYMQNY